MVNQLRDVYLCEAVYVSPYSNATQDMECRDVQRPRPLPSAFAFDNLLTVTGDFQDMLTRLKTSKSDVVVTVIDYAGLSTSPAQVVELLRKCKAIKYILVHHGHKAELMTRDDILETNARKFSCRVATVKRSKVGPNKGGSKKSKAGPP
ncbi:hypothetical protein DM01DRAFT_105728 [Hesseltinella vesiculosa]|uniref:Uncharacterized protein n=1 Tax=Hesseltinella vesiculosa TaxID=101127 RepID=A0A1X2GHM4_9FUNG|nr:hypothetical protein DM01DRAFT_105728 [Hesseltinella vesiculosa]